LIIWVGITDSDWYRQLAAVKPDEVNFWQPGAMVPRHMEPGMPFLFKLHAPDNFIVGGGYFVSFSVLPLFLAWEAFGKYNGANSFSDMIERMSRYRESRPTRGTEIGCSILAEPFFLPESEWIPIPVNWSKCLIRKRRNGSSAELPVLQYGRKLKEFRMRLIITTALLLLNTSCVVSSNYRAEDIKALTDRTGRVEAYIRSDGAITDTVGRVLGYIEDVQ